MLKKKKFDLLKFCFFILLSIGHKKKRNNKDKDSISIFDYFIIFFYFL